MLSILCFLFQFPLDGLPFPVLIFSWPFCLKFNWLPFSSFGCKDVSLHFHICVPSFGLFSGIPAAETFLATMIADIADREKAMVAKMCTLTLLEHVCSQFLIDQQDQDLFECTREVCRNILEITGLCWQTTPIATLWMTLTNCKIAESEKKTAEAVCKDGQQPVDLGGLPLSCTHLSRCGTHGLAAWL